MENTTYEFQQYCPDGTSVELIFQENEDTDNCYRFHDFCKRAAIAFGYLSETVERVFGETNCEEML